jgi:hypothetical protein
MSDSAILASITASVIAGVMVLLAAIGIPVRQVQHNLDTSACHGFGQASGYQTKFVDYNFWNWDCLAKASDGKWISTQRLHDVNVEGR